QRQASDPAGSRRTGGTADGVLRIFKREQSRVLAQRFQFRATQQACAAVHGEGARGGAVADEVAGASGFGDDERNRRFVLAAFAAGLWLAWPQRVRDGSEDEDRSPWRSGHPPVRGCRLSAELSGDCIRSTSIYHRRPRTRRISALGG